MQNRIPLLLEGLIRSIVFDEKRRASLQLVSCSFTRRSRVHERVTGLDFFLFRILAALFLFPTFLE